MKRCSIISPISSRAGASPGRYLLRVVLLCLLPATGRAQTGLAAERFDPLSHFSFENSAEKMLTLHGPALPNHPFTVTGRSGAILGMQDGTVELWQLPVKLFSGLHLRVEVEGYTAPIELNPLAAELTVAPDHSTLTYAHAAITVRQHMFVPAGEGQDAGGQDAGGQDAGGQDAGGVIVFEIHAIHPATLVVSLTPAMVGMWPAPQPGQPGWEWRPVGSGGVYAIGTDNPHRFGMLGMPDAQPGAISPYQEHPHTLPLEFRIHYDPARDDDHLFPLLGAVSRPDETNDAPGMAALQARLLASNQRLPAIYARTQRYYADFFRTRTTVHTPDPQFDRALQWAELAIDKMQVTTTSGETGLVAGWFPSFDSARPGFGWFFGRDALWSIYAIDSYGDGALAQRTLEFLMRRQRPDGKMMHEYAQTAGTLTGDMAWNKLPYEYAAADATPLFLLAMKDYGQATGDLGFVRTHWDAVERAYRFERTHDSDGDGVYDNAEGTGWVEGWPPRLPHQELYLAALDRDATLATAQLAGWTGHPALAKEAQATAAKLAASVEAYRLGNGLYAFSKNSDGSYDPTLTIYPAAALWSAGGGLGQPEPMLEAWAGNTFATDWGARAVAETDPVYDPISYHQGTVWPLFTGWSAMAAYRGGHPLAGYAALRRNVDLTWTEDPGAVTEVLSGHFYQSLGRSSTHQLWSSAMVLAPALRGLFGLEPDAFRHTLAVHPHLPPSWDAVTLEHLHVGDSTFTLTEQRAGAQLVITATSGKPTVLCLRGEPEPGAASHTCAEPAREEHRLSIALPPLELALSDSGLPSPGSTTAQPRIVNESYNAYASSITVEALAGSQVTFALRRNGPAARAAHTADGGLEADRLRVTMPGGKGFVRKNVTLQW